MRSRHFLVFGTETPPSSPRVLRAGPLTLEFDEATAALRRFRIGETEVLRTVSGAVRDPDWGTVLPVVRDVQLDAQSDWFHLAFQAVCKRGPIDYVWDGEVQGAADGTVQFLFDGEARVSFLRNRIGLYVLHPLIGCVGRPCLVEHLDGGLEEGEFPRFIAPYQVFKQIKAITHEPISGTQLEVRFEGEVFEMEDHRNWTDASFKTYGTPLEQPFPVRVPAGERLQQSVTVRVLNAKPPAPAPAPKTGFWSLFSRSKPDPTLSLPPSPSRGAEIQIPPRPKGPRPPLGLVFPNQPRPIEEPQISRLQALRPAHLRADLVMSDPDWPEALRRAVYFVGSLPHCPLHLAVMLSEAAVHELEALRRDLQTIDKGGGAQREPPFPVGLWLILPAHGGATRPEWIPLAREKLGWFDPRAQFAAGTDANFAELNRQRPPAELGVLPCYAINPQVHAFDHRSLMENLDGQPDTLVALQAFSEQQAVISPITLRRRRYPALKNGGHPNAPVDLPPSVDARQMTLFNAAWTLGSLARLCTLPQLHSLTYYETHGWCGVVESVSGSLVPDRFPSQPNEVFPVYHVLVDLAGYEHVAPTLNTAPQRVAALTLFDRRQLGRTLLANLTAEPQPVRVFSPVRSLRVRPLNAERLGYAIREPENFRADLGAPVELPHPGAVDLTLSPYAVVRISFTAGA